MRLSQVHMKFIAHNTTQKRPAAGPFAGFFVSQKIQTELFLQHFFGRFCGTMGV